MLATILLLSWMRAGLSSARTLLELVSDNHHRFDIVQDKTIPIVQHGPEDAVDRLSGPMSSC